MLDRYDQDLLLEYLEGELEGERLLQLKTQLAEDPQLATLLEAMSQDRALLRSLPQADAPGDLVQDVTQSLERRMLLDDSLPESGPIPLARGRGLATNPEPGVRWGRVAGLTGLAASVAIAAGIVIITHKPDTLMQTADRLASPSQPEGQAEVDSFAATGISDQQSASDEAGVLTRESGTREIEEKLAAALADAAAPNIGIAEELDGSSTASAVPDAAGGAEHGSTDADALALAGPPFRETPGAIARGGRAGEANSPDRATIATLSASMDAVALATDLPRQQLVLFTEAPDQSKEHLVAFCVHNGIPIVRADEAPNPISFRGLDEEGIEKDVQLNDDELIADKQYALLINEDQLQELVANLNATVSLEQQRAKRVEYSAFNTQAAWVNDLPQAVPNIGKTKGAEDAVALEEPKEQEEAPAAVDNYAQRSVQLRLPGDLGSTYANSRNRDNLDLEQRRNSYQAQPVQLAKANLKHQLAQLESSSGKSGQPEPEQHQFAANPAAAEPQPEAKAARQLAEGISEFSERVPQSDRQVDAENKNELVEETDKARDLKDVDPSPPSTDRWAATSRRGNWLEPHLPLADTTPLLIWRRDQAPNPTQLVEVAIKQVPAEQVRTLRLRAQNTGEQAEQDPAAGRAESEEGPAIEVEPESEPGPAEAVEALGVEEDKPADE